MVIPIGLGIFFDLKYQVYLFGNFCPRGPLVSHTQHVLRCQNYGVK